MIALPPKTEIIRAYLLEVGDVIIYNNSQSVVRDKKHGLFYLGNRRTIGENSREYVILVKSAHQDQADKMSIKELSKRANIKYNTVKNRICNMGWSLERALKEPLKRKRIS